MYGNQKQQVCAQPSRHHDGGRKTNVLVSFHFGKGLFKKNIFIPALTMSSVTSPKRHGAAAPPSAFIINILAGGGAGILETTLSYPLDLIRTRMQMVKGKAVHTVPAILLQIARQDGVLRLYRGLLPPLVSEVPRRALKFTSNDFYKGLLANGQSTVLSTTYVATLAGVLTGMTETVLHTPFEVVKIRLQAKEFQNYKNSWHCAQEIVREEGFLGFYRGFEAYLYRQGIWNGAFFGIIGLIREDLWPRCREEQSQLFYDFWTGVLAGGVATVLNTPLDVIKTRIQCMTNKVSVTPWCLPLLMRLFREEGFRACFKGLNARLYRAAPGSGILLLAYGQIHDWLTG